jgi:agmatinase
MTMPSFLESEFAPAAPQDALFHIIPVPYEASVSYGGGTAQGPEAILAASSQLEAWDGISAPGELGLYTAPPVCCAGSAEQVMLNIEAAVSASLEHKAIPVLLGGEHSISYGAFAALCKQGEPFGIVQFDAHCDLRNAYEGQKHSHASVMYLAVSELHLPLVQLGNRDFCREEVAVRERYSVVHYDAAALFAQGLPQQPLPADFPKNIYISFDVDGLDAALMPATGTPSPGGLGWYEALSLLERCIQGRRVIGCDVVELAPIPHLHYANFTAAKLVHALLGMIQRSR